MTSNEEMAEKLAEKFYGLIEGDVSVSGGELAKLFVTALDQAGLALSEKAKAYISFEPVLPNGKTLAGHVRRRHRRPGILERTPSWQRKMTLDLSRTRSYPTK